MKNKQVAQTLSEPKKGFTMGGRNPHFYQPIPAFLLRPSQPEEFRTVSRSDFLYHDGCLQFQYKVFFPVLLIPSLIG